MEHQKIIIVGASSGIGRALANLFATKGHKVGIAGRRTELLEELAATRPDHFYVQTIDVTDTDACPRQLDLLAETMDGIDCIIVSAGGGDVNDSLDFEKEQQMISLNVSGFTCVADWAFRYFKKQGKGHLAAITSVAGMRGSRQAPAYSATKAYQINYLQGLRQKAYKEPATITITDICPGFVDTPAAKSPIRFWVSPIDNAAAQIYEGLRRRKKVIYISRRWGFIAWLYKWIPAILHERM